MEPRTCVRGFFFLRALLWYPELVDNFPIVFVARDLTSDPLDILWHCALGYMPDFLNGKNGRAGWVRWSHRGVQLLDNFHISPNQKRYVLSSKFELRFDRRFEEVVHECAANTRRNPNQYSADTWLTPELIRGLIKLHRMGYAHSYESWSEGRLVGGTFGIQLGGYVSMMSLFHRVSNASKAATGQAMMHLNQRGFKMVDVGMVPKHHVDFGAEWMPRWRFELLLRDSLSQPLSTLNDHYTPPVPWPIRCGMPVVRTLRALQRRLGTHAA